MHKIYQKTNVPTSYLGFIFLLSLASHSSSSFLSSFGMKLNNLCLQANKFHEKNIIIISDILRNHMYMHYTKKLKISVKDYQQS